MNLVSAFIRLEDIGTKELIAELVRRGAAETDNEGQYLIYTGMYEKESA
jgi:hypothetical protein